MKRINLVIMFLISLACNSQTLENKKNWIIKTNLISLVDFFSFPTIQFGVEKKINTNLSLNVESGYQLYSFDLPKNRTDTLSIKNNGFKFNIEIRYYLNNSKIENHNQKSRAYIGIQPFYRGNNYGSLVNYSIDPNYDKPYNYNQDNNITVKNLIDEFEVKKSIFGLNAILGNQMNLTENLILESYFGIGIMDRQLKNFNRGFKNNKIESQNCNHCFFSDFAEGSSIFLNLTYGVRIGYKL